MLPQTKHATSRDLFARRTPPPPPPLATLFTLAAQRARRRLSLSPTILIVAHAVAAQPQSPSAASEFRVPLTLDLTTTRRPTTTALRDCQRVGHRAPTPHPSPTTLPRLRGHAPAACAPPTCWAANRPRRIVGHRRQTLPRWPAISPIREYQPANMATLSRVRAASDEDSSRHICSHATSISKRDARTMHHAAMQRGHC